MNYEVQKIIRKKYYVKYHAEWRQKFVVTFWSNCSWEQFQITNKITQQLRNV